MVTFGKTDISVVIARCAYFLQVDLGAATENQGLSRLYYLHAFDMLSRPVMPYCY